MAIPEYPISRIEHYLARANGQNVTPPDPISRIEHYLAGIAGGVPQELLDDVADLKSHIGDVNADVARMLCPAAWSPTITKGYYIGSSDGKNTASDIYCRTSLDSVSGIQYIGLDPSVYSFKISFYDATGKIDGTGYIGSTDYSGFAKSIPTDTVKFAVSIRRVDRATMTDADVTAIASALSAFTTTDKSLTLENKAADAASVRYMAKSFFADGNNLIPLSARYEHTEDGITIKIESGIVTLTGRRTVSRTTWFKITNGYACSPDGIPDDWLTETLPQFEAGKTYSLHYVVLSGTIPSGFGVVVKYASGSNMLSASIREATATETPAVAQIATARNVDVNVSFIPIVIEGGLSDEAYWAQIAPGIKVTSDKFYPSVPTLTNIYDSAFESIIKLPSVYETTGDPTPLIILCHGLSSTLDGNSWGAQTVADKFVNAGYAVMDVNRVTTQDWCNPELISKYMTALKDILTRYNVKPMYVYGLSMGSLIGLCMSTVVPGIKAAAISGIRLDLEARYNELSAADKAIVDANLGFTDGYDAYKAAGWCKTAFACVDASGNKINPAQFPPTIFIYGTTDTLTKEESLAKIDEIKRGMTICVANEYVGDHGAVCTLSAGTSLADTLSWYAHWS